MDTQNGYFVIQSLTMDYWPVAIIREDRSVQDAQTLVRGWLENQHPKLSQEDIENMAAFYSISFVPQDKVYLTSEVLVL